MAALKRGLGKGIDSIIPPASEKKNESPVTKVQEKGPETIVKISKVEPNPEQPRKKFDEDAVQELADSIKQCGV